MNIKNVTEYIDYLKNECKLNVSVHFSKASFSRLPHEICVALLPYNLHSNPYCMAIKKNNHEQCRRYQNEIRSICSPYTSICCTCFAGVSEYIYPICKDTDIKGFIAASGYAGNNAEGELKEHLSKEAVPIKLCDVIIPPLSIMLEKLFSEYSGDTHDEYNHILQFLNEYHTNITVSDLAKYFNRSVSHISHMFKSKSGVSFSEYCNNLKLTDAERLLRQTDFSITQISFDVGFSDVSYFIVLFKRKFGITPLQYRAKLK